jgi:4-hydroxythreonine-4-phosphate dehydrogenase
LDIILALYHDQGLPLFKFVNPHQAANITLGLPIIRTSVDHGTAFGKAGKGTANCDSLKQALQSAVRLAKSGYYDNGFQAS